MNQKGISQVLILLGVVAFICLTGIVYHLRIFKDVPIPIIKQSDQNISLKEYNNGFYSLKYPANWNIDPQGSYANYLALYSFTLDQAVKDAYTFIPTGGAAIQIWGGKSNLSSLYDYVSSDTKDPRFISQSDITIGDMKGKRLLFGPNKNPGMPALQDVHIVLQKDNIFYTLKLSYHTGDTNENHFLQVFDNLSSSFQLDNPTSSKIQPTQSTTTSSESIGWKTYTDPILAASFQYPQNWVLNPGTYGISTPTVKDNWYVLVADPTYGTPGCRGDCPVFDATFTVNNDSKNYDLETVIRNDFQNAAGGNGNNSSIKEEDFTNASGIKFKKVSGFPGGYFYLLYTSHNNKIYSLGVGAGVNGMQDNPDDPKVSQDLKNFDQIISTFKFID